MIERTAKDTSTYAWRMSRADDLDARAQRLDVLASQSGAEMAEKCRNQAAEFRSEAVSLRAIYEG